MSRTLINRYYNDVQRQFQFSHSNNEETIKCVSVETMKIVNEMPK